MAFVPFNLLGASDLVDRPASLGGRLPVSSPATLEEDSTPVANDDEVRLLVDCLNRFGVLDWYIRIEGDVSRIPAGNEVYVSRIDDAIRVFNRLVRERETSDKPTKAKGARG